MSIDISTETAIFERLVLPAAPPLDEQAARSLLAMDFDPEDRLRMQELIEKARQGTLSADEQSALDNYERVGHYLAILRSKARLALKSSTESGS